MFSCPRRLALLLSLAAITSLGACHDREEQEQFDTDNELDVIGPDLENTQTPAPLNDLPPANVQAPVVHAPPPTIDDEQQVLDDAAAAGMTAPRPKADDIVPDATDPAENGEKMAEESGHPLNKIY